MAETLAALRSGHGSGGPVVVRVPPGDGTLAGAALAEARRVLVLSAALQWAGQVEVVAEQ